MHYQTDPNGCCTLGDYIKPKYVVQHYLMQNVNFSSVQLVKDWCDISERAANYFCCCSGNAVERGKTLL